MSRPLQDKLKAKRAAKANESKRSENKDRSRSEKSSTATDDSDGGFVELEWERHQPTRPNNRQRAVLGVVIALLIAWAAALGWLVLDSLG